MTARWSTVPTDLWSCVSEDAGRVTVAHLLLHRDRTATLSLTDADDTELTVVLTAGTAQKLQSALRWVLGT